MKLTKPELKKYIREHVLMYFKSSSEAKGNSLSLKKFPLSGLPLGCGCCCCIVTHSPEISSLFFCFLSHFNSTRLASDQTNLIRSHPTM